LPTPEFRWIEYEIRVPRTSPLIGLKARLRSSSVVDEPIVVVDLPDLSAWQSPLDKAEILLESAAEIEHALMVQYLYAAYSLKSRKEVSDPAQKKVLYDDDESPDDQSHSWPHSILAIAREEMGHLLTVQNLLLALGLPPNFEREDFPPRKDLYPFALHLEPLSQHSLAKYVVAEAPTNASDIDDIVNVAQGSLAAQINHVGVLYGLLGLVFAKPEQVQEGATSGDSWDAMVRHLALAAGQQASPDSWHLPDSAFEVSASEQQAEPSDWQVGGLRVHRVADRATARAAIRDIGAQGEGPTSSGEQSHFERFRRIYRGQAGVPAFPAGEWVPTRNVSTDPRVTDFVDQRTRRWAELADIRYGLLLGFVEHYLLTSGDDRKLLTGWIFAEMRSRVGILARKLTTMSTGVGSGVASIPFTLPVPLHLPGAETARWSIHKKRVEAAITKVQEIQPTTTDPADRLYLSALLASDQARLAFIATRTIPSTSTTSFNRDILPLFRPVDIEHMTDHGLDLSSYETVKRSARRILARLRRTEPDLVMPPPPHQRWTKAQTDLFERWIAEGHPV
jgi:Ferritin-like